MSKKTTEKDDRLISVTENTPEDDDVSKIADEILEEYADVFDKLAEKNREVRKIANKIIDKYEPVFRRLAKE